MAQAKDVTAIRDLAKSCIVSSIPSTRDAQPEEVQAFCEANYQDLAVTLKSDRNFLILVEEDSSQEITGYLMLDFGQIGRASCRERV